MVPSSIGGSHHGPALRIKRPWKPSTHASSGARIPLVNSLRDGAGRAQSTSFGWRDLPHSTGLHWPTKKINENQVSRWIKGQTQVTSFRFEEMNKIEQAMPHHLLVLLFISFLFSFFSGINHWSVDQQFFPSIIIGPLINCSSIENLIVHLLVRWKHHLLCVFPFF